MAAPTVFRAAPAEKIEAQIGDEIVDLSRLPMGVLLDVIALVGDDPALGGGGDLGNVIEAIAAICKPSNPRVTKEYLMGLDAFEEVVPFMKFALGVMRKKMEAGGIKNGQVPSS